MSTRLLAPTLSADFPVEPRDVGVAASSRGGRSRILEACGSRDLEKPTATP